MVNNHYIKAAPIIYIRPSTDGWFTSALSGDSAWNIINNPDPYIVPEYGTPALLTLDNAFKLVSPNVFGHTWRWTGINGGYYDVDTAEYKTSAGTVSNIDVVFGTSSGSTAYLIDHHTGMGWKWVAQSNALWGAHTTTIANLTWNGYTDWFMPSRIQMESIVNINYSGASYTATTIPFQAVTIKTATPTVGAATTAHQLYTTFATSSDADNTNDGCFAARWHFTGQTTF